MTPRVVLIDGTTSAELMIDHGVGVTVSTTEVKRLDLDYFVHDDAPTVPSQQEQQ